MRYTRHTNDSYVFFSERLNEDTSRVPYSWASKQEEANPSEIITVLSWISDLKCSLTTQHETSTFEQLITDYQSAVAQFEFSNVRFRALISWWRRYRYTRGTKRRRKNGRFASLSLPWSLFTLVLLFLLRFIRSYRWLNRWETVPSRWDSQSHFLRLLTREKIPEPSPRYLRHKMSFFLSVANRQIMMNCISGRNIASIAKSPHCLFLRQLAIIYDGSWNSLISKMAH